MSDLSNRRQPNLGSTKSSPRAAECPGSDYRDRRLWQRLCHRADRQYPPGERRTRCCHQHRWVANERFDGSNPAEHFYLHAIRFEEMFARLTSTQVNAAFPASGPVRTVMAWALFRSAANDTGSMAPKDRKENTEGVSE